MVIGKKIARCDPFRILDYFPKYHLHIAVADVQNSLSAEFIDSDKKENDHDRLRRKTLISNWNDMSIGKASNKTVAGNEIE